MQLQRVGLIRRCELRRKPAPAQRVDIHGCEVGGSPRLTCLDMGGADFLKKNDDYQGDSVACPGNLQQLVDDRFSFAAHCRHCWPNDCGCYM